MTSYSAFLRRIPLLGEILEKIFQTAGGTNSFILDSTSFKIYENVRFCICRLFPDFAEWAYSSTRKVFGFKLHIAIDGQGKIVAFRLISGNRHDSDSFSNFGLGARRRRQSSLVCLH
ncbi:MAG: transposase [Puniceicoccales bacterium]|nr:transposase [Puniceicoccales bacterium]